MTLRHELARHPDRWHSSKPDVTKLPKRGSEGRILSLEAVVSKTRSLDRNYSNVLAEIHQQQETPFKIFAAKQPTDLEDASALLTRRYAWRGYSIEPTLPSFQGRLTLSAVRDEATVATISANPDEGECLYVEQLFPDAVGAIRTAGRKPCEFTRFAVDESVRSPALIAGIFHVAYMYVMDVHGCTDALIEVNPRHVRFYEQMLGFKQSGESRWDPVVVAPAVLLRLDLSHSSREIDRLSGRGSQARKERSFYPHFFPREEAFRIVRRLNTH